MHHLGVRGPAVAVAPGRCQLRPKRAERSHVARVAEVTQEGVIDAQKRDLQQMMDRPYKYGFKSLIESDTFPKGLSEDVVRAISAKKDEPEWMLDFRLKAYRMWLGMKDPRWSDNRFPEIDYQDLSYYSAPKQQAKKASLDEVDPELLATFDKLGIPLNEQKRLSNVAVDAVFDSVSIATTFRAELFKAGVIFCSFSEAVKEYPDIVRKHLGTVVRHWHLQSTRTCHRAPCPPRCRCLVARGRISRWCPCRGSVLHLLAHARSQSRPLVFLCLGCWSRPPCPESDPNRESSTTQSRAVAEA